MMSINLHHNIARILSQQDHTYLDVEFTTHNIHDDLYDDLLWRRYDLYDGETERVAK